MNMKSLYALWSAIILVAASLLSCEKAVFDEDNENTDNENCKLTLCVSTKSKAMDVTRSDGDYWKHLCFVVYKDGKKLKAVNQTAGTEGYGQASISLAQGTYQVLVVAHSSANNPSVASPDKVQFTNADGYSDTFYYYSDITVTAEPQTHYVELVRATAMLRFIVNDDMPQSVKSLKFYYTGGSGALNAKTGMGCVDSKQTVNVEVDPAAGAPYTFELYTIPKEASGTLSLTVTAFDGSGTTVAEKQIKNIKIERNKITELSGELFNGENIVDDTSSENNKDTQTEGMFVITANTEWGGTINATY